MSPATITEQANVKQNNILEKVDNSLTSGSQKGIFKAKISFANNSQARL